MGGVGLGFFGSMTLTLLDPEAWTVAPALLEAETVPLTFIEPDFLIEDRAVALYVTDSPASREDRTQQTVLPFTFPPSRSSTYRPFGNLAQDLTLLAVVADRVEFESTVWATLETSTSTGKSLPALTFFGVETDTRSFGWPVGAGSGPGPGGSGSGGVGLTSNAAVTERAWSRVTEQLEAVPEHAPLQPVKVEPDAADAVSSTMVPSSKLPEQAEPQSIGVPTGGAGVPVTVPLPVPDLVMKNGWEGNSKAPASQSVGVRSSPRWSSAGQAVGEPEVRRADEPSPSASVLVRPPLSARLPRSRDAGETFSGGAPDVGASGVPTRPSQSLETVVVSTLPPPLTRFPGEIPPQTKLPDSLIIELATSSLPDEKK